FMFLLPWFDQAHDPLNALRGGFTNYTPFYGYVLILWTAFDGLLPPLLLIKSISFVFELGCAAIAYRLILSITGSRTRATSGFAAVWLAPSVIYNGALWGQAESIWTFFLLLSIYWIAGHRYRLAMLAFAVAVSIKLQAVFLGPLVFAL